MGASQSLIELTNKGFCLIRLFLKDGVKNFVDYVLGVEAGLDSNAQLSDFGTDGVRLLCPRSARAMIRSNQAANMA